MKTKISTGIVLAICLAGSIHAGQAQTTDTTRQILQMQTFREGLVWIGNKEPGEAENEQLLGVLTNLDKPSWTSDLTKFLQDHPNSPWAASLSYDYASFYRRTGRTTKALEQFEAAWALTKNDTSPTGRKLGGAILANWMDLLSSLGRTEKLKELIAIGDQWHFVGAGDRDKFQGAKHSYYLMQEHPGIAYRCGTFALKALGEKLQSHNPALEELTELPSPTNGFSMAALVDLAKKYGLNLVPVRRSLRTATIGQDLIVPSVVHWRQNHYAAILDKQDDNYLVSDPTFGAEKWISGEAINEEASGEFLVPAASLTNGWTQLARNETEKIRGKGLPNNINDGKDKPCIRLFSGQMLCTHCPGMPEWWVSEPYINVWFADQPLSYLTSRGEPFTFQITYKQRDTRVASIVSTAGWNNSWQSYIHMNSTVINNATFAACDIAIFLPNGGEADLPHVSGATRYDSEDRLMVMQQGFSLTSGANDGDHGLRVIHSDGSQDIYGAGRIISISGDYPYGDFFRTRHIDPNGDTTWFQYNSFGGTYVLTSVVDPDGRTNFLSYNTSSRLLLSVTNAYGQSAHFKYDSKNNLTNIVDAQGLSSSITWDTNNYPTSLITPYGTTTFSVFANSLVANTNDTEGNFGGDDLIDRSVLVTDPVGAKSLYMYRYDCSSASPVDMSPTFSSSDVPTNTPLGTLDDGNGSSTNTLAGVCYRNSFYWGPRQYAGLSTTNIDDFVANDYVRGRMKHWLEDTNQLYLTGYLSVERDPSPDGTIEGLKTFYDYQGKLSGYNFCAGNYPLPSVRAWRLPNGETHYEYLKFDYFGNLTNDITTYTLPNGSMGTRTNQFIYADNTYTYLLGIWNGTGFQNTTYATPFTVPDLLAKVIGADGSTIWAYGGFDTVTWTNFFYSASGDTNGSIMTSLRVLPDYATNGVGQVATTTYTSSGMPVNYYDMFPGGSLTNYNYGTLEATAFAGCNKITSSTSVAGLITTNIYNAADFPARIIDLQIGRTNSFSYTANGLIGTWTNELNLSVDVFWDNLLRLTGIGYPDGTGRSIIYSKLDPHYAYDRLGHLTIYGYDGARHLTSITRPNSTVISFDWCGCGALTEITDSLYHQTSFNYDNQGNLTNIAYPDGSALNYQYNPAGQVTNLFDGAGRTLRLAYNNQGLLTTVASAAGTLRSVVYDIMDRPYIVTDANGVTVTNTYDAIGELVKRTWADGISESYGYNAAGLIAYTNRDGRATLFGRNAAGWLTAVTNANNEIVRASYNPAGEIISLTDGLNHTRSWQYNEYGLLTNKLDGLGRNVLRLAYNPDGWLTNRWTPEKGNTGYAYDNVGNLETITYPQSSISYFYDALNRLTNMMDAAGTTVFSYSPMGLLTNEDGPWTSDSVGNTYAQGLRAAMNIASSWSQTYAYDLAWRMTNTVTSAGTFGYTFGNGSSASTLLTKISLPNGASITNGYDALARLTKTVLNDSSGHSLDAYTYTPDPLGLRTNIFRDNGLTNSSVGVGYDNIGEITSWIARDGGGALRQNEQLGFGYDAAHNLHTRTSGTFSQTFSADAADELTGITRSGTFTLSGNTPAPASSVTVNGLTADRYGDFTFARTNLALADGNNTFTNIAVNPYGLRATNVLTVNLPVSVTLQYDANGNLTNDGARSFAYDTENQLTNVSVAGQWKSEFVYDGLNRRRIERDYSWNGLSWTKTNEVRFIYDGYLLVQERDTNNNVLVTYTRGLDLSDSLSDSGGIGGLLARTDGSGSTFYHADALGNITALMDSSQNIVGRYLYNPFGKLIGKWGSMADANVMRFSTMPVHRLSGMPHFALRDLDTDFPQWLTQDPIGEAGGIPLHEFVYNNPLGWIDPWGLSGGMVDIYDENTSDPVMARLNRQGNQIMQQHLREIQNEDVAIKRALLQSASDSLIPKTPEDAIYMMAGGPELYPEEKALANAVSKETCPQTYEILNGVHRAKAAHISGMDSIPAIVNNKTVDIPINKLLSPYPEIDLPDPDDLTYFMERIMPDVQNRKAPSIIVQPGSRGTPITSIPIKR